MQAWNFVFNKQSSHLDCMCIWFLQHLIHEQPLLQVCSVILPLLQLSHLGDDRQRCTMIQKNRSHIFVPFPCREVQRGVAWRGGCVGRCSLLQQLLHNVCLAQAGRNVQWGLVILNTEGTTQTCMRKLPLTLGGNICPHSVTFLNCTRG